MRSLKFYSAILAVGVTLTSCDKKENVQPTTGGPEELSCAIASGKKLTNHNTTGTGVDYIVSCEVEVTGGNLEIAPDVTIEFKNGAGLNIREQATIKAVGTVDKPIIMRGQGSGNTWKGISIWSEQNTSKLAACNITGAGSGVNFSNVIAGYTQDIKAAIAVWGRVDISTVTITGSDGVGIAADYNAALAFSALTIQNCKDQPLYTYAGLLNSNYNYNNCSFTGNGSQYIGLYSFSSNEVVEGTVSISKAPLPYLATTGMSFEGEATIAAGVEIRFANNTMMGVNSTGSLAINGTTSQPVIIRGATPTAGFWKGMLVNSDNPKNVFNYLNISDGGSEKLGLMPEKTNIAVADVAKAMLTLNNCTSTNNSGSCQVSVSTVDGALTNNSPQITSVCSH